MLEVKKVIRRTEIQEAEAFAHQILTLSKSQEIKDRIRERNIRREVQTVNVTVGRVSESGAPRDALRCH